VALPGKPYNRFCANGRKRAVDVFSWESVAAQTVSVYERAMKRVETC
jgi:glycosyltransferase involved in cell wall biosynthesis